MKILVVAFSMLKRSLSKKSNILIYIFTPIIALIIPILFYGNLNNTQLFAVVNNDKSIISEKILNHINDYNDMSFKIMDKKEADKKLVENRLFCIISIPENFTDEFILGKFNNIEITYTKESKEVNIIKSRINSFLNELYRSLNSSGALNTTIEVDNEIINRDSLDNRIMGFIMIFFVFTFTNSLSTIIKDRNNKVYNRILLSATSSIEYIIGQVLWNFIICLIQIVVIICFINIFNISLGISINEFLYTLLCIGFMSMAVGVFIISLCSNENQISVFSTLIIFPSSMISGCLWPIEIMSDNLQKLSYIFPQRYIFILLEKFSGSNSIYSIVTAVLLIFLVSLLFMTIGLIRLSNSVKEFI